MKVVIDEAKHDTHPVSRGCGVVEGQARVLADRIVDVSAQTDQFRGSVSVASERSGIRAGVVVDDAAASPEGDCVFTLHPRNSLVDGGRREDLRGRTRIRVQQRVETGLEQQRSGLSRKRLAESGVAEVEDIDDAGAQNRGVLRGESLAVVAQRRGRWLPGKLRGDLIVSVARESAAGANRVLSSAIQVQIDLSNQCVIAAMG